jgi:hypothetical protein
MNFDTSAPHTTVLSIHNHIAYRDPHVSIQCSGATCQAAQTSGKHAAVACASVIRAFIDKLYLMILVWYIRYEYRGNRPATANDAHLPIEVCRTLIVEYDDVWMF